jgi:hypothetical protein
MLGVARLVKKYKADSRPQWVKQLVTDANEYLESFRQFMKG